MYESITVAKIKQLSVHFIRRISVTKILIRNKTKVHIENVFEESF